MTEPKRIAILGSTGSIGTQALQVIADNPDVFRIEVLTAGSNADALIEQSKKFSPSVVVIADEQKYHQVKDALAGDPVKVLSGHESLNEVVSLPELDLVLTAMVGYAGLKPTITAIQNGKTIALANKETLVVAGDLITRLAADHDATIIPVDSEHSAIYQCLVGENHKTIDKIILTASGGPFRTLSKEEMNGVTLDMALKHPNWDMGAKITIDSASLMNKGLEAIEAKWLFDVDPEQIEVVVHPQSIIHSMVEFSDGSIKAQMGLPDMRLPILYALGYPKRLQATYPRFNFTDYPQLTFEYPDTGRFPNLRIAFEAMKMGGNQPCAMNAANEVAVAAFLEERIGFLAMTQVIENTLDQTTFLSDPGYDDYVNTDREARELAWSFV